MSNQQNRLFRCLRLAVVALSFVLYPFFVNQLPLLTAWFPDIPLIIVVVAAIFFAIIVIFGPDWLNVKETPPEELRQKFWAENQKRIQERLKTSLDQENHIPLYSTPSPDSLERPHRKEPHPPAEARSKDWITDVKSQVKSFLVSKAQAILPQEMVQRLPQLPIRRNLENLKTKEMTPVPASKPISEIFNEAKGRLLILGEPGSGKTTELLKLAESLGEVAEQNPKAPIPVIFELSGWRKEPMLDWMVGELVSQYGLNRNLCRDWLVSDRILPLLDGLDELGSDGAKDAIKAIDELQEHNKNQQKGLVICCRVQDYQNIRDQHNNPIRLRRINQAVRLCELTPEQIQPYLEQRQSGHLWDEIQLHPGLMNLAKIPMLLNLMPIAYPDGFPPNLPASELDCQSRLFEGFLQRKLQSDTWVRSQPFTPYTPKQARKYLAWLAASMGRPDINQREFLVEKLQPNWLGSQQIQEYHLIFRLIFGVINGLFFGLFFGLSWRIDGGIILKITEVIFVGTITFIISLIAVVGYNFFADKSSLKLVFIVEYFCYLKNNVLPALKYSLTWGLIEGVMYGLILGRYGLYALILALSYGLRYALYGLIGGLILGLIGGLLFVPSQQANSIKLNENFDVSWHIVKPSLFLALQLLIYGLILGLIIGHISGVVIDDGLSENVIFQVITGLNVGLITGLILLIRNLQTELKVRK